MIAHPAVLIPAAAVAVILTLTQKLQNKIAKLNQANKLHNQRIKLVRFRKVKKII